MNSRFYSPEPAKTFKKGDRVLYEAYSGETFTGTISDNGAMEDAGLAYCVDLDNGMKRWGYVDQFTAL